MTMAALINELRHRYGLAAGPEAVAFAKAQICRGQSLVGIRYPDGRETHFVTLYGIAVLALWDDVTAMVVTFPRLNIAPARLQAFVAGMRASIPRQDAMPHPFDSPTIAAIKSAPQVEHDRLVAEARRAGGWTAQVTAAWAGACAREDALDIAYPFTTDEPDLRRRWLNAYGQGRVADLPTAEIHGIDRAWAPRPGTTHAARCAVED